MKPITKTALIVLPTLVASLTYWHSQPAPQLHAAAQPASQTQLQQQTPAAAPAAQSPATATADATASSDAPLPRRTIVELKAAWKQAHTLAELEPIAQALAEHNTAEAVSVLLDGIEHIKEWPVRAALAKNLRAVSDPETLQALLPALLNNYGRGNTILNEISDTIARLAQPETVEALAALHWQASVQAGQGHKVLRTVAIIRNPIAARGLMKIARSTESPALAAAAVEALRAMDERAAMSGL